MRLTSGRTDLAAPDSAVLVEEILRHRAAMDQMVGLTDGEGALVGPFACLPYSPSIGSAVQAVGVALRADSVLSPSVSEAAILAVAVADQADFEWHAHERISSETAALGADDIARIAAGELPVAERAGRAVQLTRSLLAHDSLSAEEVRDGVDTFGERGLVELVILVGYYHLLALLNVSFETPLPPGAPPPPWLEPSDRQP